jgi:hypothetical protein
MGNQQRRKYGTLRNGNAHAFLRLFCRHQRKIR